jgi:amino acid transporter
VRDRKKDDEQASQELARLGYAQELLRGMGGFSTFALSFSIISVLTGVLTTYDVAIGGAGPAGIGYGWPLVTAGTLLVAGAMAELASAFPTAGALYHWAALLGGKGWGWMVAATNLAGQIAIVAAIDMGCAELTTASLDAPGLALPCFVWVVFTHAVVNVVSIRVVGWLNDLSATVHIAGVVLLVGAMVAFGLAQPPSFLFHGGFTTREDGSFGLGFLGSLMLGMYTFTGYDASAHVSEETHDPARRAPWGIVSSVAVSGVFGYALAAAVTLGIHDLPTLAAHDAPALEVLRHALGPRLGSAAMGLATVAMWFCGLSSVTSASRTLFAFARDGGVPGSRLLRRVGAQSRTPHVAIVAIAVGATLVVGATRLAGARALSVATALATTMLYVSYAVPIALGAVARSRGRWTRMGPFRLGRLGVPIAWAAVAWAGFVVVVFVLPPRGAFALVLGAIFALLALAYALRRAHFDGPSVDLRTLERRGR